MTVWRTIRCKSAVRCGILRRWERLQYQLLQELGAIQVLRNTFFWKLDHHPPPRNANNIEPYTFVTLFSGKCDTLPLFELDYLRE